MRAWTDGGGAAAGTGAGGGGRGRGQGGRPGSSAGVSEGLGSSKRISSRRVYGGSSGLVRTYGHIPSDVGTNQNI